MSGWASERVRASYTYQVNGEQVCVAARHLGHDDVEASLQRTPQPCTKGQAAGRNGRMLGNNFFEVALDVHLVLALAAIVKFGGKLLFELAEHNRYLPVINGRDPAPTSSLPVQPEA